MGKGEKKSDPVHGRNERPEGTRQTYSGIPRGRNEKTNNNSFSGGRGTKRGAQRRGGGRPYDVTTTRLFIKKKKGEGIPGLFAHKKKKSGGRGK